MNTYIIPYWDEENCDICKVCARNLEAAQSKFAKHFVSRYGIDIDYLDDYENIVKILQEYNIYLGPIYDSEEF